MKGLTNHNIRKNNLFLSQTFNVRPVSRGTAVTLALYGVNHSRLASGFSLTKQGTNHRPCLKNSLGTRRFSTEEDFDGDFLRNHKRKPYGPAKALSRLRKSRSARRSALYLPGNEKALIKYKEKKSAAKLKREAAQKDPDKQ